MTRDADIWSSPAPAFGVHQEFAPFDSGWRTFPRHYLLYASAGVVTLEVATTQWLLFPSRAAWIAAEVPIRVHTRSSVLSCSVLFTPEFLPTLPFDCRVFAVSPLAREMLVYAMRWDHQRDIADAMADHFFRALAAVCTELAAQPDYFWLPRAQSPELRRAVDYTLQHLAERLSVAEVAHVVGVAERTLARRFAAETHMTWRQFVRRARLIRALELLVATDTSILEISGETGFASVSAFITMFRNTTGETPAQYRRRLQPN